MRASLSDLCHFFGYSRQGYAKRVKLGDYRNRQADAVVAAVNQIRSRQPRVGVRKLHQDVNHALVLQGVRPVGRDRLFAILRRREMLVVPLKRFVRTTNSYHRFRMHKNVLKTTVQTGPNQAWVADITYLRLRDGFCYLSLVTDVYSRKIVGFNVSKDLSAEGAMAALRMALKQCPASKSVIHHSDRGIQYCCNGYAEILSKSHMVVSMTEENHCYENSMAERVNETLKYDFMLGEVLPSFEVAKMAVEESIEIYNNERRHVALGYVTPQHKHAA